MAEDAIKRIDIREFRVAGYLQEVNRRLLHPLGLALEVVVCEDGTERLGGVWDYRDDPEGIAYGYGDGYSPDALKAAHVEAELDSRRSPRTERLGFFIEPVGDDDPLGDHDG